MNEKEDQDKIFVKSKWERFREEVRQTWVPTSVEDLQRRRKTAAGSLSQSGERGLLLEPRSGEEAAQRLRPP